MLSILRALSRIALVTLFVAGGQSNAQSSTPNKKQAGAERPTTVAPVKGYRIGQRPSWVVEPPAGTPATAPGSSSSATRRELLVDVQSNYATAKPQSYVRRSTVATDASTLGTASQQQIQFNPAFQTVVIHEASVRRDGRKFDRLKNARIELMRREQRLENSAIDGTETLLVVLSDVRVGEPVELSYTIEGQNPIYEGRISTGMSLAWDTPIELLHHRLIAPADRTLHVRGVASTLVPERFTEHGHQVLRIVRRHVEPVLEEKDTPPWFKVYPLLQVSEYASWSEVDSWARRLFAAPAGAGPLLSSRVSALRDSGLRGEQLVAEVLRFVQDEVRYFSVSVGESSHRPKAPERTLSELLGDCKDKVALLNALLGQLGFDVKPALVSVARNRGLAAMLPSHDLFDHVITRLELDGKVYFLDPTINGQGLTLTSRGYLPYGYALVVGAGDELQVVGEPTWAINRAQFEQRWNLSEPDRPARLSAVMRWHGLAAEQWRNTFATAGMQRVAEFLSGAYARVTPGLKMTGEPQLKDDRQANVLELVQTFELPDAGSYSKGGLELEFTAIELYDSLVGPQEARRRTPFLLGHLPRSVESRIEVLAPRQLNFKPPAPFEVNDRHFRFSSRSDINGSTIAVVRRVERRADEVLPEHVEKYRESLLQARSQSSIRLRLSLIDFAKVQPDVERMVRSARSSRGFRDDRLTEIVLANEFERMLGSETLKHIDNKSRLAARVLAQQAAAANLLGRFHAGLADADAALAIDPDSEEALEARAISLVGEGQLDDAMQSFSRLAQTERRTVASHWMGAIEVMRGRPAEAERLLRQVIDSAGGDEREFALLWLYVSAEYQGGRGVEAVAPYLESADAQRLPGAILRFLGGRMEREALLKLARESSAMERLNLAEAYFFIGQQSAAQGRRDEALSWFKRVMETNAVPYREVTFSQLELKKRR